MCDQPWVERYNRPGRVIPSSSCGADPNLGSGRPRKSAGRWAVEAMLQSKGLPIKIMDMAVDMFAGATGFSGPEIHRFFAHYADDIPDYAWGGGSPPRRELFRTFLGRFPLEQQ